MIVRRAEGMRPLVPVPVPEVQRLRGRLASLAAGLLARVLGTADGHTVAVVAARELSLILRSREWSRFTGVWLAFCSALLAVPILVRSQLGRWSDPTGEWWLLTCGYGLQIAMAFALVQWTVRRLRRDLYSNRLDELMLTRCSAADLAMGESLASAVASIWLVACTFPACLFLAAIAGQGVPTAVRLTLSLAPAAAMGVWFGMGWGLAFTLRRSAANVPLTQWWLLGPFLPIVVVWSILGCFPVAWVLLRIIPGGEVVLGGAVVVLRWLVLELVRQVVQHWNPLLVVAGAGGLWGTTWFTDWLSLILITTFMMRKSMDSVQAALGQVHERDVLRRVTDYWIHHDGFYFTQYGEARRREPPYRDGGNPVAAFDVAFGHRVYLHPFLWCVGILVYLSFLGWSLLVPHNGLGIALLAVLTPATGALVLMSCGVAISFGWERDQHRWPALAVLPLGNLTLAAGKIQGVVRPTLRIALLASMTALLLGWRGALDQEASLWMALHVLVFPVALAFVSATLALTTPTVGEAISRWIVLGALPTVATLLPYPVGGESGLALPFSPPLLVLVLVIAGPSPALIRGAWISLGLEILGIVASLVIMTLWLRRWTVGERD